MPIIPEATCIKSNPVFYAKLLNNNKNFALDIGMVIFNICIKFTNDDMIVESISSKNLVKATFALDHCRYILEDLNLGDI